MREIIKKKWNKYRNKPKTLVDVLFIVSILAYLTQLIMKVIKPEMMLLEIPDNLVNFFIFKNIISRHIIDAIGLSFNIALLIAIASRKTLKVVYSQLWFVFILIYFLDTLPTEYAYYLILGAMLLANIRFGQTQNATLKEQKKVFVWMVSLIIITALFQMSLMYIRFDFIQPINESYGFVQEIALSPDMFIIAYLYYKKRIRGVTKC